MPEIRLRGVTKVHPDPRRGQVRALDALDLVVPDASLTVLTGPAGSGKTTVLRVVAGLDLVDSGRVEFDGVDVTGKPTRDRDVALVTPHSALLPRVTVRQQLAEALRYRQIGRREARERVMAEARALGLEPVLDRPISHLPAGDRQRVALGRALVRSPTVFLLDEPLAAVDAHERQRLRTELSRLWRGLATTTLYVTHDVTEAMALADQIAFLDAGRLVQLDTPQACYHRPATALVAATIGGQAARIVDAEVADHRLRIGGIGMALTPGQRQAIGDRQRVLVAVRATSTRNAEQAGASQGVPVAATVERVVGAGPAVDLEVVLEPGGPSAPRLVTQAPPTARLRPGDAVIVRVDIGACSIFDATDGRALHHGRVHGPA